MHALKEFKLNDLDAGRFVVVYSGTPGVNMQSGINVHYCVGCLELQGFVGKFSSLIFTVVFYSFFLVCYSVLSRFNIFITFCSSFSFFVFYFLHLFFLSTY